MMTITHIQYTVKAEYVAHNKENIRRVVEELRALGRTDLSYRVFVEEDGKTFVHLPLFASAEAEKAFSSLQAFKIFLSELQASHPEVLPRTTNLSLVDSTSDLL